MGISPDSDERGLLLAMLSVLAGLKVPDAGTLIRRVLLGGLLESDNALWSEIERFVSPEAFWEVVQEHTDFPKQNPSLNKLFVQLLVTHFALIAPRSHSTPVSKPSHHSWTKGLCIHCSVDARSARFAWLEVPQQ